MRHIAIYWERVHAWYQYDGITDLNTPPHIPVVKLGFPSSTTFIIPF